MFVGALVVETMVSFLPSKRQWLSLVLLRTKRL